MALRAILSNGKATAGSSRRSAPRTIKNGDRYPLYRSNAVRTITSVQKLTVISSRDGTSCVLSNGKATAGSSRRSAPRTIKMTAGSLPRPILRRGLPRPTLGGVLGDYTSNSKGR